MSFVIVERHMSSLVNLLFVLLCSIYVLLCYSYLCKTIDGWSHIYIGFQDAATDSVVRSPTSKRARFLTSPLALSPVKREHVDGKPAC